MSDNSGIEWTDATWNPTTGCTKVSPGCDNCYAERLYNRFHGKGAFDTVTLHPERLEIPFHWRRPRRVFVDSMSDLFHVDVPREFIGSVFSTMQQATNHTYQILTKRAERMERVVGAMHSHPPTAADRGGWYLPGHPLENVWLGVSVESMEYYARIRHLQRTPAAVRFLSCEPLLGPLRNLPLDGIHWVIAGGESGPGARPMHPDWVREIRDQCVSAGVPFFFKQWGQWWPIGPVYENFNNPDDDHDDVMDAVLEAEDRRQEVRWLSLGGETEGLDVPHQPPPRSWYVVRLSKKVAGRDLDEKTWDEMPTQAIRRMQ